MPVTMEKLPPLTTVVGAMDVQGQRSAREAGDLTVAAVRRTMPARSGRARRGQSRRVTRFGTGWRVEVAPRSRPVYPNGVTAREVTRWVDQGTGIYGPRGRRITPRRAHAFRLPSGWRSGSVRGQQAQHVYARVESSSEAQVFRVFERGSHRAARAMEAALDG